MAYRQHLPQDDIPVASSNEFVQSSAPEPHRARTKDLLRRHPEIRALIGPSQRTFWYTIGIVLLQFGVAWLAASRSWWLIAALAYTVGAFASHALFVSIHECAHRLVFRRRLPNILTGLMANLPLFTPGAVSFQKYHLKHHAFQGVYELDADVPSRWEARLIGRSPVGKALWLLFYPVFQMVRSFRIKEVPVLDRWTLINVAIQVGVNTAVYLACGPKALGYLSLSLFFSIGLHPLGARWIQRHYLVNGGDQETFSYYGLLNAVTFNVGYHNEHHDFPSVAWNRLPRIRAAAPETYDDLSAHASWTRLLGQFLFDRNISLYSRIIREDRAGVPLSDEVRPDLVEVSRITPRSNTRLSP
ncbi:MAG TPA: fatty acid desaturase [Gemmatimonadales bacterium]|nr:fatty acid desaturase [Gemmatimonadales bacterium]